MSPYPVTSLFCKGFVHTNLGLYWKMQKRSHSGQPPSHGRNTRSLSPGKARRGDPHSPVFPSSLTFSWTPGRKSSRMLCKYPSGPRQIISPMLGRKPRKASQAHVSTACPGNWDSGHWSPTEGFHPAPIRHSPRALLGITPYPHDHPEAGAIIIPFHRGGNRGKEAQQLVTGPAGNKARSRIQARTGPRPCAPNPPTCCTQEARVQVLTPLLRGLSLVFLIVNRTIPTSWGPQQDA